MSIHTYLSVVNDSIICLHDPAYMRIHDHVDEGQKLDLVWHYDDGRSIELTFNISPFKNGQTTVRGQHKIKEKVKDHKIGAEYKYSVKLTDSSGNEHTVDPGLIIKP